MMRTPADHRMIRVDHAGEVGACALYQGQRLIWGQHPQRGPLLEDMECHEQKHRHLFEDLMRQRHVRPSLLLPLWKAAGYGLGVATACMGYKAAMTCTVAVECVIDAHYAHQKEVLQESDPELKNVIEQCQADEQHHHDTALQEGAEEFVAHQALSQVIRKMTKLAIFVAERL